MKRIAAAAFVAPLIIAVPAMAQSPNTNNPAETNASSLTNSGAMGVPPNHFVSKQDRQFLEQMAKDNQGEIRVSVLGEMEARNPAVKAFARLMVDDHNFLESEIAHTASGLQQTLPTGISDRSEKSLQKLFTLKGGDFDVQFMHDQIAMHQAVIGKVRSEERSTGDQAMRALTETALPILQQHLQLAQDVNTAIQGGGQPQAQNRSNSSRSGSASGSTQAGNSAEAGNGAQAGNSAEAGNGAQASSQSNGNGAPAQAKASSSNQAKAGNQGANSGQAVANNQPSSGHQASSPAPTH